MGKKENMQCSHFLDLENIIRFLEIVIPCINMMEMFVASISCYARWSMLGFSGIFSLFY